MPGSGKIRTTVCVLIFVATTKYSTPAARGCEVASGFYISHFTSITSFDLSSGLGVNLGNPSAKLSKNSRAR